MEKAFNTAILENGEKIELSLTFLDAYRLRERYPDLYKEYNLIVMNGVNDEIDYMRIIYTAYVCRNLDKFMDFEEFLGVFPPNRMLVVQLAGSLLYPDKKKVASQKHS